MPRRLNAPLSLEAAQAAIRAVETAMAAGALYPMPRGAEGTSAIMMAAKALGLSCSALSNRLGRAAELHGLLANGVTPAPHAPRRKAAPKQKAAPAAREPASSDEVKRAVRLEDEISRLRREKKDWARAELDAEAIRRLVGSIAAEPATPPDWLIGKSHSSGLPEVPATIWADWHGGEVVRLHETNGVNSFDTAVLERRVRRLVETTIHLLRDHGPGSYPGIVINLLGDFVSGALHAELAKTDEESVIQSALRIRDLLVWALDRMIDAFGRVFCPCASGNHARNTPKPEFKRYVHNSFDWLIYEMLRRHYAGRPEIVFLNPDANEVLYRVYNVRYLGMHGDMLGVKGGDGIIGSIGPIMRGSMKVGKQASAIGRDFDRLLLGHWHQPLMLPGITVANCLKGFDEYAKNALRATPSIPSQPLWLVHPKWGQTAYREVLLEDPVNLSKTPWTSWSEAA
jgi:hypothetical protein